MKRALTAVIFLLCTFGILWFTALGVPPVAPVYAELLTSVSDTSHMQPVPASSSITVVNQTASSGVTSTVSTTHQPVTTVPDYLDNLDIVDTSSAVYTYEQMEQALLTLQARYPHLLRIEAFGTTADNRKLYAAYFGNQSAKRTLLVQAGIHGREYLNCLVVMKELEYYLHFYETGRYGGIPYSELFSETTVCVVPMLNPDGVSISQSGLEGIRSPELQNSIRTIYNTEKQKGLTDETFSSYLKKWKANANGVDLNRNFAKGFGVNAKRNAPSHSDYRGPNPASEAETQAILKLADSLPGLVGTLSYHSYGEMIYWECEQIGAFRKQCLDYANLIKSITGYRRLGAGGIPYIGSFADEIIGVRELPNVTVETGGHNTPLSISEFPSIWNETRTLFAASVWYFRQIA